jgi:putative glutamine amidotransferase
VAGGGAPLLIPHRLDPATLRSVFDSVDGLLLSGGGDVDPAFYDEAASEQSRDIDRERDELEITLARWAVESQKPFLAICRGIQVMNVALGGSLYQDVQSEMPGANRHAYFQSMGFARDYPAHDVQFASASRLAQVLNRDSYTVNSLHHQGIKRLAPGLAAVGHAPDGLVEAVELPGHEFALGVQWHPEALAPSDPIMQRLFETFVEAARRDGQPR